MRIVFLSKGFPKGNSKWGRRIVFKIVVLGLISFILIGLANNDREEITCSKGLWVGVKPQMEMTERKVQELCKSKRQALASASDNCD